LVDELEFTEAELKVVTHIHKLTKVKNEGEFVCRGTKLFKDSSSCQNVTKETSRYMYECTTCKGKNKNGDIKYCVVCAQRDDKTFKVTLHEHDLTLYSGRRWGCDGSHGKDGCKSNDQTSGILRYRCVPCDYDNCEYCLAHYH